MKNTVLFDAPSELNRYKIVDMIYNDRKARVLFAEEDAPQSGMPLDGEPELLFNYNQRLLEICESMRPASVLVIGGGAFTLPSALLERFTDIVVDVVEIDPLLPELAKEYFELPDDPRLSIVIQDGFAYAEQCDSTYDLIVIDVFSGFRMPGSIVTPDAVRHYARCLSETGVVAVNFIARYRTPKVTLARELVATFGQVFETVDIYQSDYYEDAFAQQNLLLIASRQQPVTFDYLQSAPVKLTA